MKLYLVLAAAAVVSKHANAFTMTMQTFIPPPLKYNPSISSRVSIQLSTTASATATLEKTVDTPQQTKTLGLLTFDLGALQNSFSAYFDVHIISYLYLMQFSFNMSVNCQTIHSIQLNLY